MIKISIKGCFVAIYTVCISIFTNASADEFWNTDFEYSANQQPRVWTIEGEGTFTSFLDSNTKHSGNKSLYLSLTQGSTYIYVPVNKAHVESKSLKAIAYIKHAKNAVLKTSLILFDPASKQVVASSDPVTNDTNWQPIRLTALAEKSSAKGTYLLAFQVEGTGELWLDDLTVTLDDQSIGIAKPDFSEPSVKDITRLNRLAHPLKLNKSQLTQFNPLSTLTSNAKVIAVGENSHGSATIFQMKLQMLKYLVRSNNVSVFALEMPLVEADEINDYVQHRSGDYNRVVEKLTYPSWQTEEMLSIINWLREYNRTATQKVAFRGFDMQDSASALRKIMALVKPDDTALYNKLVTLNDTIKQVEKTGGDFSAVLRDSKVLMRESEGLFKRHVHTNKSKAVLEEFNRYAKVVHQSLQFKASGYSSAVRGRYMAENIHDMVGKLDNGSIVVSADNTHVSRLSGSMGSHLSDKLGEQYWALGVTFQSGTYSAYGDKAYYDVHEPYVGTYEYLLSKSQHDNFLIDLSQSHKIKGLSKAQGFRMIGSRPQEVTQFAKINIRQHFDAILFLRQSTHTRKLMRQQQP